MDKFTQAMVTVAVAGLLMLSVALFPGCTQLEGLADYAKEEAKGHVYYAFCHEKSRTATLEQLDTPEKIDAFYTLCPKATGT